MSFYESIRKQFNILVEQNNLYAEGVHVVSARPLTPEEAIGSPERKDFPLLAGREVMLQASFRDSCGQAFTDMPGNFSGAVRDVLDLPPKNNFQRAVFVASLNAVMRHLGQVGKTVHCRDKEPGLCAEYLADMVGQRFGSPRIAFIGLQPAMVHSLVSRYQVRVTDLDRDNVGLEKCGVTVEDAGRIEEVVSWADIVLATGTMAVNNTIGTLKTQKPTIFYGVTIAGVARLCDLEQFCHCGR